MMYLTAEELPPNGVTVDTIGPNGTRQSLYRENNLWWFPNAGMYVYYVPTEWSYLESPPATVQESVTARLANMTVSRLREVGGIE